MTENLKRGQASFCSMHSEFAKGAGVFSDVSGFRLMKLPGRVRGHACERPKLYFPFWLVLAWRSEQAFTAVEQEGSFWSMMEMFSNWIVVIDAQFYKLIKITELYIYNECIL